MKPMVPPDISNSDRYHYRSLLSKRAFLSFCLWQLAGIAGIILPELLVIWIISIPLVLLLVYADFKSHVDPLNIILEAIGPSAPEINKPVELKLNLRMRSPVRTGVLSAYAPATDLISFDAQAIRFSNQQGSQGSYFSARLQGTATKVGFQEITGLTIDCQSILGLWLRRIEIAVDPVAIRVSPSRARMREEEFRVIASQQRLLFQGNRLRTRARSRDQFHSIRPYIYPDPIRDIDQKKSAKYQHPMVRTYETVHQHHLVIALDVGRGMYGEIAGSQKCDFYLSVSLALARQALENQDLVSFVAFSQREHMRVARARSLEPFERLFRGDVALNPREEESNYDLLHPLLGAIAGQRSIVVILSDISRSTIQEALLRSIGALTQKHLMLVLGLLDRNYDLDHHIKLLPEAGISEEQYWKLFYACQLAEETRLFNAKLADCGAMALQISEEHWLDAAIRVYRMVRQSLHA